MTLQFPTTVDAFVEVQNQLSSEPVGPALKEALAAWVPLFNSSFEDGRRGDMEALVNDVERLDALVEANHDRPTLTQFLTSARVWMIYAWKRGAEAHDRD